MADTVSHDYIEFIGGELIHCPTTGSDDSFVKDRIEELDEKMERISNETKRPIYTRRIIHLYVYTILMILYI